MTWQPGQSGNPEGRRPGSSRTALAKEVWETFKRDWDAHGASVIAKVRENKPDAYLAFAAKLVPASVSVEVEIDIRRAASEYTTAELIAVIENKRLEAPVDAEFSSTPIALPAPSK